jgi:hypothetical protein
MAYGQREFSGSVTYPRNSLDLTLRKTGVSGRGQPCFIPLIGVWGRSPRHGERRSRGGNVPTAVRLTDPGPDETNWYGPPLLALRGYKK